jgi:hypothetical protein
MAMQPEVRYINAYVSGNVAVRPEKMPQKQSSARLPKARKQQKWLIQVDLVAIGGIMAALVLSIMLVTGLVQMNQAKHDAKVYREYATSLKLDNTKMRDTYASEYDLNEVRDIALNMGMVPVEQVEHVTMQVVTPEVVQEPTAWESFWAFFLGMFA